jgi:hypothetical protein
MFIPVKYLILDVAVARSRNTIVNRKWLVYFAPKLVTAHFFVTNWLDSKSLSGDGFGALTLTMVNSISNRCCKTGVCVGESPKSTIVVCHCL